MTLTTVLVLILIVLLIGVAPAWPYSREWGPYPVSILGIVLIVVLILFLTGRL